jgi:hypothetical protein
MELPAHWPAEVEVAGFLHAAARRVLETGRR